jgi:excisionase family DNA binding protein
VLNSDNKAERESEGKLLLTVSEAAVRLGIGRSHTYQYVLRGELESVKLGRSRRVPLCALQDFVEKLRSEQSDG